MVRIHGNYCGSNWTAGKAYAASDPRVNWRVPCVDKLDCACKKHDRDCAHPKGCSAKADRALVNTAYWIALFGRSKTLRAKAAGISTAIAAASLTRRR